MSTNPKDLHILLVEDDETNQMVIKIILHKMGYKRISVASDSVAAVTLLEKSDADIDIILMDLGLPAPGVNGIELTKKIRQSHWTAKDIPIIALTGNSEGEAKEESFRAGMNEFLTKPVDAEKLKNVLESILQQN